MTLQFVRRIQDAEHIFTYYFKPERTLRYIAGQFLEFHIPHDNPDDRGEKRWFTVSSSPTETHLAITTKIDPKKPSTFKHALHNLNPGDTIEGSEAMGDFVLPKDESTKLIFIAGGIGVTPFRSMITWLAQSNKSRDITLLYMTQDEKQVAFRHELDQIFVSLHIMTDGKRRTAQELADTIGSIENAHIYISGPEPMAKALATDFRSMSAHAYQVVTDYFPGYESI